MLRELLKFEARLQANQIGFWVTIVILTLVGLLAGSTDALTLGVEGGGRIKVNGAYVVASFVSTISVLVIFFAAVFVVTGLLRDDLYKSLEFIHSTPVKTSDMVASRMIVVWITTVLCASSAVFGYLLGQFMPWADAEKYQGFNVLFYLQPTFLFIVINALLVTGFYTLIAVITRNRAIVYVSAVGLFVLAITISAILTTQAPDWARSLLEPFGGEGYLVITEYWPAAEKNSRMVPIFNFFGLNRLFIFFMGLGLFLLSFKLTKRGIINRRVKGNLDDEYFKIPKRVDPVKPSLGIGYILSTVWTRTLFEFFTTMKSVAIIILISLALVIFAINIVFGDTFNPSPTLQTSSVLVNLALGSFGLSIVIIMVFFGSDIMWRDRTANIHHIVDATPVKSVSMLFAKWGGLALLLLSLVLLGLMTAFVTHITFGETSVVPKTYLAIGILNFYLIFFFQGMLVMFIQNFMPGRVIGMFVSGGVLIALIAILPRLPFYHPIMGFGRVSPGVYSEMAGFSSMNGFWWEFAYWMGLIIILGAMSVWVWRRGDQAGLKDRFNNIGKRMSAPSLGMAAVGAMLFVGFGYAGLQSYKAENYMNSDQREARQAEFEKLVADIWADPEPRITKVSVDVDFYPDQQTAEFRGSYVIDNPHETAISRTTLFSGVGPDNITRLDIEGAQTVSGEDLADELRDEHSILQIEFNPPLKPGETRRVDFTTRFAESTLTESSDIVRNGTFVNNTDALLVFGNMDAGFIGNPDTRRKYDLGERVEWPEREDEAARQYNLITAFAGYADYVDFDARVCTIESQIPVAPGKFRGETVEEGRRCREYRSINPILNFFSFLTAEYEVRKGVWSNPNGDDVELEIYFHPEHNYNIDLMFDAMRTSMETYTETFSPYQYAQLRIMEFPYRSFAQAFAGTVPFSERIGFVQDPGKTDDPKRVDFASYVTMHEIGHQWFAHQLIGAYTKGSNLLSEGLTENATMLAYERQYGFTRARRMHEVRTTQRYLLDRAGDPDKEPVLAEAESQGYLNYNKTSWVFWGMRHIIGNDDVQRSVKRFLTEYHGTKGAPYPTTLELIDILKEEIDPKYHQLIDDYWNKITFWDLSFTDDIDVRATGDDFTVSLPIKVDKKYASEEDGKETSVSEIEGAELNEWLEIGFYTEDPKDDLGASPFATRKVRVDQLETVLEFKLNEKPTHVILDPKRLLIERNINDNTKTVNKELASSE